MTGEGMADRDDAASVYSARALGAEAANFDDLGDAEKVKFSQAELGAAASLLDDLLARYAALRTEVQDPDGLVRLTLGSDGRLVELYIHDQIAQQLDNLGLERLLNTLLQAGNEAVEASLQEFRTQGLDWS
ncbi:hypothetical protein [Mycobacterium sp. 155]|uniref:hypothetical protein n=1 Tax=Mycobacterium sp. 155 TaxID=1157943 RepID=UPI00036A4A90|nr:hypothetical protein [Mycobacterium sp. 155]